MRYILFAPLCLLVFLLNSCRQIPNEGIPFYLKIDSVSLVTNPLAEGPNTHGITDVWVEANATNIGAYEVPVSFPVLLENQVRFVINPGIRESGQTNVRVNYPFFQPDTFTLIASRGQIYNHTPIFRYKPGVIFPVMEDFESGNSFNGLQRITDSNVRFGTACGKISVSAIDSNEMGTLISPITLPAGFNIWLELDYKAEVPFYIGFYANYAGSVTQNPVLFVREQEHWNKIYVNLTNPVGYAAADTYTLYFEALRPFGTNGGSVYLDNIKVVHL